MDKTRIVKYIENYSLEIAVFMLNFDNNNHMFRCDLTTEKGSLIIEVKEVESELVYSRTFEFWKESKKDLPKKDRKNVFKNMYDMAIEEGHVEESFSIKEFITLVISQMSIKHANEANKMEIS